MRISCARALPGSDGDRRPKTRKRSRIVLFETSVQCRSASFRLFISRRKPCPSVRERTLIRSDGRSCARDQSVRNKYIGLTLPTSVSHLNRTGGRTSGLSGPRAHVHRRRQRLRTCVENYATVCKSNAFTRVGERF